MSNNTFFPRLSDWAETRETLHAYSRVLGAIREAYTPPQPHWWHISLRPYTAGLTTTPMPHPEDPERSFALSLDLRNHYVLLSTSDGEVQQFRIAEGLTATALGKLLLARLAGFGVKGEVPRKKFESEAPRRYAMDKAERYFSALAAVHKVFEAFRGELGGNFSPVQLWPHHFDFSFELFSAEEIARNCGENEEGQPHIGFGFAPMDESQPGPYFYVNPTPFADSITQKVLPEGASWFTESWKGAVLPYAQVAENTGGEDLLLAFLRSAFEAEQQLIER